MKLLLICCVLSIFLTGCATEKSNAKSVQAEPETVKLNILEGKSANQIEGDPKSSSEVHYIYDLNIPIDKLLEQLKGEPELTGWKNSKFGNTVIFSNRPASKTQIIAEGSDPKMNNFDTSHSRLSIFEFDRRGTKP